jgi:hypothetical protein
MVVEVRGVKNVTGVSANAVGVVAVPEAPKVVPADTANGKQPRDSVRRRQPADTIPPKPRRPATNPRRK